jgi:hypothetical protein
MRHGESFSHIFEDHNNILPWLVVCLARPQAMSQAKPGHDDGFIVALAWLGCLKSQSQAVRLQLFSELYFLNYVTHLQLILVRINT